ncbi:hypothetical protein ACLOJK_000982 [Asimina triloba]
MGNTLLRGLSYYAVFRRMMEMEFSCFDSVKVESSSGGGGGGGDFTCEVCLEETAAEQRFRTLTCAHPLCLDCIARFMESKLGDNVATIACPHAGCEKLLDPGLCRPLLPACVFERWCDVLCESSIDGLQKAYCPYKDCSALVLNECGGPIEKAKCPNCLRWLQKAPWWRRSMGGFGFGFWQAKTGAGRDPNEVLFRQLVKRKGWQKCPRCKRWVERVSGCQVMTCR